MRIFKSKIFWVIATLFIGAISNGVWEYMLKPLCSFAIRIILNITTFGIEFYKNDIYIQISKGFREYPSIFLVTLCTALLIGIMLGSTIGWETRKKITASEEKFKIFSRVFIIYTLFVIVVVIFAVARIQYINSAVTHFKQLYDITSPYIDDKAQEIYVSKFAQIRNKKDYSDLISEFEAIAKKNGQNIPEFTIW